MYNSTVSTNQIPGSQCTDSEKAMPIEINDEVTVNSDFSEAEIAHNFTTDSSCHAPKDCATLDNQNKIIENQEKILKELENLRSHKYEQKSANSCNSNGKPESEDTAPYLARIRTASDMQTILNSPLVANIFTLKQSQKAHCEDYILSCKCCKISFCANDRTNNHIVVKYPHYSQDKSSEAKRQVQPRWFRNLMAVIIRHTTKVTHKEKVHEFAQQHKFQSSSKVEVLPAVISLISS